MNLRLPTLIFILCTWTSFFTGCNTHTNNVESKRIDSLIEIQKLNNQCIQIKFGADAITAINSKKGIVIIDAGISTELTSRYRRIIENQFPGNDFAYLINSHFHPDHIGGNGVFSESRIVGHSNCLREITEEPDNKSRSGNLSKIVAEYDILLQTSEQGTKEWDEIFTQKIRYQKAYIDAMNSIPYVEPDITFSDSLIIDMSDVTLELFYFGKLHSDSDILIYVPQMSILFTGDLFFRYGKTSFNETSVTDKEKWQQAIHWIEKRMSNIDRIIEGHGQILSTDDLKSFITKIKNESQQG